eukprot:2689285-Amphidinium_carterae.1
MSSGCIEAIRDSVASMSSYLRQESDSGQALSAVGLVWNKDDIQQFLGPQQPTNRDTCARMLKRDTLQEKWTFPTISRISSAQHRVRLSCVTFVKDCVPCPCVPTTFQCDLRTGFPIPSSATWKGCCRQHCGGGEY